MKRYNSYTLSVLDSVLKKHPSLRKLSEDERINIYNLVQELVWKNKSEVALTYNITITTNILQDDSERQTIYTIDNENLSELRKSLYTLNGFLTLAKKNKYLQSLNETQRVFIYNLAQQSIASYRNRYNDKEYILSTSSFDKYTARISNINTFADSYPTLTSYVYKTAIRFINTFTDSFPTLSIKGIKTNIINTFSDSYPILSIKGMTTNQTVTFSDSFPILSIKGVTTKELVVFIDTYPTLSITTTPKINTTFVDSFPILTIAAQTKSNTTITFSDIYPTLIVKVPYNQITLAYNDSYPILTAKTLYNNTVQSYADNYPTLTIL